MRVKILAGIGVLAVGVALRASLDPSEVVLWPERERAFLQDGPGLLLEEQQLRRLETASPEERALLVADFLDRDPLPETEANELLQGIERRVGLVRQNGFLGFLDDRARLLFLHGAPTARDVVDCGQTFVPIEIWTYPSTVAAAPLVLYQPIPGAAYRLWLPSDSKRILYNKEMEYWLEQWEELRGFIIGKRFDLQICPEARQVDKATGVDGLRGFQRDRPRDAQLRQALDSPVDLAAWSRVAAITPLAEAPPELALGELKILFPDRVQQRVLTRFLIPLPAAAGLGVSTESDQPELVLAVKGVIEQRDAVFEEFRVRFKLEPPPPGQSLALVVERPLRSQRRFLARLQITDEISGAEAYVSRGFEVPAEPQPVAEPPVPEGTILAMGERLAQREIAGRDSLLLVPPPTEIVLGLWRAEALVTGSRIVKVSFLVDGAVQLTRNGRPFTAELRLAKFPVEQVVRAEGYDEKGELVASDEVVLNQPRGSLRVRILEPARGVAVSGSILSRVEVVVPEERRVEQVEFKVNEQSIAIVERPPWQAQIEVPETGDMAYLTVTATLDDGSRAEEVRFLNAPRYLEEVDVKLVELFTTVTDRSGRLVRDLTREEFEVREDGRPQTIVKFELVEDLPLTVALVIDTSTSMADSLAEAKQAALGFLHNIITRRDRVFAVSFDDRPRLLIPPTDDVVAVEEALEAQVSEGWTSLHDAVVTSLYYFRGIRGRRAMVLLSDGDDTASSMPYRDALEYARRSGVAIYSIGLDIGSLKIGVRNKLNELAQETGGRSFVISRAEQLSGTYQQIEQELRSQYLLAYNSDRPTPDGEFRHVEVRARKGKLKARTISGYYP